MINFTTGYILKNVQYINKYSIENNKIEIDMIDIPFAYIVSQPCDIKWSTEDRFSHQKLINVLLIPAYEITVFQQSLHVVGLSKNYINYKNTWPKSASDMYKIKCYKDDRFHYIDTKHLKKTSSSFVLDFKHYFTLNVDVVSNLVDQKKIHDIVEGIYKEDISLRFSRYLSRIGLPDENLEINKSIKRECIDSDFDIKEDNKK